MATKNEQDRRTCLEDVGSVWNEGPRTLVFEVQVAVEYPSERAARRALGRCAVDPVRELRRVRGDHDRASAA